jgi:hypothetical protein
MTGTSHKIGMVTPYAWTVPGGVNQHIAALAERFTAMGHRVTIIAPSDDKVALRQARDRVRSVLLDERSTIFDDDEPYPRHFFAGGTYTVRHNRAVSVIAAPLDLISNIDVLLEAEDLDLLHVHEPFVPSLGWTALRHARCPMVATFHANSERFLGYWVTRPFLKRYFDAFDATVAVSRAARDTAAKYFEGYYNIIPSGVDLACFSPTAAPRRPGPLRVLFVGAGSRRKGLRVILRALRRLADVGEPFELHVCGPQKHAVRLARLVPEAFVDRVIFHGRVSHDEIVKHYRDADVFCAPALGHESFGVALLEAMATGTAIIASDIDGYRDLVTENREGILVPPGDARALAAGLRRLIGDAALRERFAAEGLHTAQLYSWDTVAAQMSELYEEVFQRLKRPSPQRVRARARARAEVYADLHIHSHHSSDCVMAPRDILARARETGLDIIAVTDHNTTAGGREARELADEFGIRVIVGEEVKSSEGEVIGLFLDHDIPAGLSFADTVAAIRQQAGVVYVPHPFDRLHAVPSPALLREMLSEIDVLEVFNSRIAFPAFNERAERFAARYRIASAGGSDAHVLPGIGTALTGMAEFEGPADFVAALADSHIVRRRKSLIYLHSLKFLQTSFDGQSRD